MSIAKHKRKPCPQCGKPNALTTPDALRCIECYHARGTSAPIPPLATNPLREGLASFEQAWEQWQREIGMAKDRYVRPPMSCGVTEKILVIPDVHAPFHEPQMLAEVIRAEADADRVVCIWDISDAYALSRFVKYEWMPFRTEWAEVTLVMEALASAFPKVEIIVGNHDSRLEKQLRTHLTQDMVDAIAFMTGGTLCPLTALAKRYPNVTIAKHETPSGHIIDWFTTVGDAWFGHPEKFSKMPGSALRTVEDWILDNEVPMGLDRYRLIVLGHTHQLGMFPWRSHQLLVECGCLCKTQGYMTSPRIGGRPQKRGYITLTQTNGVTDLNSVKMRWLDVENQAA